MTIAVRQYKTNPVTTGTEFNTNTPSITFDSTPLQNSLIVAGIYGTAFNCSFTPQNGLTSIKEYAGTHNIGKTGIFGKMAGASEGTSFGVNLNTSQTGALVVAEITGLLNDTITNVKDQTGQNELSSGSTSLSVTTSGNIAQSNEFAIVVYMNGGSDGGNYNWGSSGFADFFGALEGAIAYQITSSGAGSTLSVTPTWPTSNLTTAIIATFKGSVSGGRPKVYLSSTWTKKPLKVFSGGSYVEKPVKKYNGSSWVSVT